MRRTAPLSFFATMFISATLLLASGCGGGDGGGSANDAISPDRLKGAWVEVVAGDDPGRSARMPVDEKPPAFTRRLEIGDGTFELQICNKDGQPIAGKKFSGTWSVSGGKVLFETTQKNADGEQAEWAPVSTSGIRKTTVNGEVIERLYVEDAAGNLPLYKRG